MHTIWRASVLINTLKLLPIAWCAFACVVDVATAQNLEVIETNELIVVRNGDRAIVTYNKVSPRAPNGIDSVYERSGCLHPDLITDAEPDPEWINQQWNAWCGK